MTINKGNKKIYETVYQQMALTEQILGIVSHSFPFAKAIYKAVCTEAIDFSMFDKVICGILQIDDVLSFEEIAEILGLNVVNRPEEGRYIDYGEKEILEFAINSLIEFNMIETGDIYHSRCRLTEIGKEYAAKGKKFLPATEKEFEIYFDLTDQNHIKAKKRFGKIETIPSQQHSLDLDIETEQLVKEVAKTQVPEIYNPEQLRNFTNLELRSSTIYSPEFSIVALVSFVDNSVRFLAFDDRQEIHHPITEMINADDNVGSEILEKSDLETCDVKEKSDIQKSHEAKAAKVQNEIQELLSGKHLKEAFEKSKVFYIESEMIDEAYLELNLEDVFDKDSREFWMILSEMNEYAFSKIKAIISKKIEPKNNLIVITQQDIPADYNEFLTECSKNTPSVFFGMAEEIEQSIFLSKRGNNKWAMFRQPTLLELTEGGVLKNAERDVFVKIPEWNSSINEIYKECRKSIAHEYFEITKGVVEEKFNELMESPLDLSKQVIEDLSLQSKRLSIFRGVRELSNEISKFYKSSREKIETLEGLLKFKLEEELKYLEQDFRVVDAKFTISELRNFEDRASKIIAEVFDDKLDVKSKCEGLIEEIRVQINALSSASKRTNSKRRKPHRSTNKKR
jgi:hypothetical protein